MTAYKDTFSLGDISPAAASTVVGTNSIIGLADYKSLMIVSTLQGATGGTLDVYLQVSPDKGTTWVDYIHYKQLAVAAPATTTIIGVSRYGQQTTITETGKGTSPKLAANTVVGGDFGDRMRTLYVAGSSTSAGSTNISIGIYAST